MGTSKCKNPAKIYYYDINITNSSDEMIKSGTIYMGSLQGWLDKLYVWNIGVYTFESHSPCRSIVQLRTKQLYKQYNNKISKPFAHNQHL